MICYLQFWLLGDQITSENRRYIEGNRLNSSSEITLLVFVVISKKRIPRRITRQTCIWLFMRSGFHFPFFCVFTFSIHYSFRFKCIFVISPLLYGWRYLELKVGHYLLFMFSPPKISSTVYGIKSICLLVLTVFYLTQTSSKQILCFD